MNIYILIIITLIIYIISLIYKEQTSIIIEEDIIPKKINFEIEQSLNNDKNLYIYPSDKRVIDILNYNLSELNLIWNLLKIEINSPLSYRNNFYIDFGLWGNISFVSNEFESGKLQTQISNTMFDGVKSDKIFQNILKLDFNMYKVEGC